LVSSPIRDDIRCLSAVDDLDVRRRVLRVPSVIGDVAIERLLCEVSGRQYAESTASATVMLRNFSSGVSILAVAERGNTPHGRRKGRASLVPAILPGAGVPYETAL